jgi:hypothetical protein
MVQDPGDLFGMQAWIDGVHHSAHAADPVVKLQVAVAVPGDARHPIAGGDACRTERARQLPGTLLAISVGVAVHVALDAPRDDLGLAEVSRGVAQDRRHQQGHIHHLAKHCAASPSIGTSRKTTSEWRVPDSDTVRSLSAFPVDLKSTSTAIRSFATIPPSRRSC